MEAVAKAHRNTDSMSGTANSLAGRNSGLRMSQTGNKNVVTISSKEPTNDTTHTTNADQKGEDAYQ